MKKCITKKALCVLLAVMLTVSVFATCLVFSSTAATETADDPGAVKINNIGYHHVTGLVQVIAGDNKTVKDIAGKDLNANRIIVVDKNNIVVKTYHLTGREPADGNSSNSGIKYDVKCPAGGYIIAIHLDNKAVSMISNQNTVANTVHIGDRIVLKNVDLDAARKLSGVDKYTDVENASFKVVPFDVKNVVLPLVSVNMAVQGETNSIITKYADPVNDAAKLSMNWTKFRRLKKIEGNKYVVLDDIWAFGNKVAKLEKDEIFLTIACSGAEGAANLAGQYVAYGMKKGDIVEITGDISKDGALKDASAKLSVGDRNVALNANVLKTPSYEDLAGKWPCSYTGKLNDGITGKRSETGMKGVVWAAFYNAGKENAKNNFDGKIGEIVVDLGEKHELSSFRTHIYGTGGSGIAPLTKVEFFVSDDNKTWKSAGTVTENLLGTDDAGVWVELKAKASGRYVKYAYTKDEKVGGVFMFVSECEAYGKVVLDVDTTGWTKVDGETTGTWQTPLNPTDPKAAKGDNVGSYSYKAGKVDGKYVVEVLFKGELTGTAAGYGNGNGTNVRVWFHSAKNEAGTNQIAYNTLFDAAYTDGIVVSRLATNSALDANKANWIYGYDAKKPYTVEYVVPTAKDGLYVKLTFDKIPGIVDNNDVQAVISVSNKPTGKSNNCLHSYKYGGGLGPWTNYTWAKYSDTTVHIYEEPEITGVKFEPATADVVKLLGQGGSTKDAIIDGSIIGDTTAFGTKGVVLFQNTHCTKAKEYPEFSVIVDLKERTNISGASISLYEELKSMIGTPKDGKVKVAVSEDGKTFRNVGEYNLGCVDANKVWAENNKEKREGQVETCHIAFDPKAGISGKHIKFTFAYGDAPAGFADGKVVWEFLGLTEIDVAGTPADPPVVIDVDTTGWTKVDGETTGTWQGADNNVGSYLYKAGKVDGKYVIEVLFKGELTGTAAGYGNGSGTNVRVWFHSNMNDDGKKTISYNTLLDVAFDGEKVVSRLAVNGALDANKANWIFGYDAEKPYTVESIIPSARDGLYVKITFDKVRNTVDNGDVQAVISVSNKPTGKENNCLHSHKYGGGLGPWTNDTWTVFADSTVHFYTDPEKAPIDKVAFEPATADVVKLLGQGGATVDALVDGDNLGGTTAFGTKGVVLFQNTHCKTAKEYPEFSVIVDLKKLTNITGATISLYEQFDSMIGAPKDGKVKVAISEDGKTYTDLGVYDLGCVNATELYKTNPKHKGVETCSITFESKAKADITAKTVKFTFAFGDSPEGFADGKVVWEFLGLTEINVTGTEAPAVQPPEESSEPSSEPSSEESSETSNTSSTASADDSSTSSPQTGDMGIAAIALLAIVTAGGVFAVRKFR